ncbi:MAG: YjbQ family protein [Candidatus Colwellbacteria bacterium]|nr:YjbQ family protein [Candidatus Colwellbacteria bacterium]
MNFQVKTKGHYDFIDVTDEVRAAVRKSGIKGSAVTIFVTGSTCALTTMEYEEGAIKDLISVFEKIAPEDADYLHHQRWGDHNGAAHIKSALIGTDLTLPIEDGELQLGTWQKIVLIDFDERPRNREMIVKVI